MLYKPASYTLAVLQWGLLTVLVGLLNAKFKTKSNLSQKNSPKLKVSIASTYLTAG